MLKQKVKVEILKSFWRSKPPKQLIIVFVKMYNTNLCISKRFPKSSNSLLALNGEYNYYKFQNKKSRWFFTLGSDL